MVKNKNALSSQKENNKSRVFLVVIDETEEQHQAIRYACRRAHSSGGRVALFKCLSPAEFQHFAGVAEIMRSEARENAEAQLRLMSESVIELSGQIPVLYVREGEAKEEILKLINEEEIISVLVLAVATGNAGPGPLVTYLTRGASNCRIPMTLVPGNISDKDIDALT